MQKPRFFNSIKAEYRAITQTTQVVCDTPGTATHCNTLQHNTTRCNTLQHAAMQHSATIQGAECNNASRVRCRVCCSTGLHFRETKCNTVLQYRAITETTPVVCVAACCSVLPCVAVCCSVLPCVAECCCVLPCVAVRCSVLQCVAVCCSVLQCVAVCCRVLPCVAVCCSVLQCVAVRCSALQCVAVCCSVL